jgi:hypothetical protein
MYGMPSALCSNLRAIKVSHPHHLHGLSEQEAFVQVLSRTQRYARQADEVRGTNRESDRL